MLEWGLALLALVVWLSASGVDAAAVGLTWPRSKPWFVTSCVTMMWLSVSTAVWTL